MRDVVCSRRMLPRLACGPAARSAPALRMLTVRVWRKKSGAAPDTRGLLVVSISVRPRYSSAGLVKWYPIDDIIRVFDETFILRSSFFPLAPLLQCVYRVLVRYHTYGKRATPPAERRLPSARTSSGLPFATDGRAAMSASEGRHSQHTGGEHLCWSSGGGCAPERPYTTKYFGLVKHSVLVCTVA